MMAKGKFFTLGLMSGTSADGIDAALLYTNGGKDELVHHETHEYPAKTRELIHNLIKTPQAALKDLTEAHYLVGKAFADAAVHTIDSAKKKKLLKPKNKIRCIGSHGQTVFHDPEEKRTLQIGEASFIAQATGITTVSDFRVADTAAGGEGAPLLPFYHQRLLQKKANTGIAVHNLGGISNFTYLGPKKAIFALDTGPASCLLDVAVKKLTAGKKNYDEGGKIAAAGKVSNTHLEWLLGLRGVTEFLAKPAPKSTGRELFTVKMAEEFVQRASGMSESDALATLTEFSVEMIREAYERFVFSEKLPLKEIVFCGGGARNTFLLSRVAKHLPKLKIQTIEHYGWNSQALEAQAFGYFAACALDRIPITFPSTTGVKGPVICGKISPGKK